MKRACSIITNYFKSHWPVNPHFFVIVVIIIMLAYLYSFWPWIQNTDVTNPIVFWLSEYSLFEFQYHIIGTLFVFPILYAAIVFRFSGAVVSWFVYMIWMLPIVTKIWVNSTENLITNIAFLLLPMLIVTAVSLEISWRAKERKLLAMREIERRQYVAKVLEAQENERKRIAQEIHDDTIQTLLVILGYSESLVSSGQDNNNNNDIQDNSERIRATTISAVENLRRICLDLRPSILDHLGLIPALRWLMELTTSETGIIIESKIEGKERKLNPLLEVTVFRIVQEAFSNIRRHSRARKAELIIKYKEDSLSVSISDDGSGFDVAREMGQLFNDGKLGVIGMQQRIESLGGKFSIHSEKGTGTKISFELKY